uniref:Uncharacterized protein n=1 Tax=Glossina brevipalpis TaxID=37001 RepID=A0A1A9WQW6_9MUSC
MTCLLKITQNEFCLRYLELTVKASDASVVKVTSYSKAHGTLHYKIKILKEFPMDEQLYVNVHSPVTMQDIQSNISYKLWSAVFCLYCYGLNNGRLLPFGPAVQIPLVGTGIMPKCSQQPFSATPAYILKLLSNLGLIVTALVVVAFSVWLYFSLNPSVGTTQINPDDVLFGFAVRRLNLRKLLCCFYRGFIHHHHHHKVTSTDSYLIKANRQLSVNCSISRKLLADRLTVLFSCVSFWANKPLMY